MTLQEAIKQLEYDRGMCLFNPSTGEDEPMNEDCRRSAEALEIAIKTLKRDLHTKPERITTPRYGMGYEYHDWRCPNCKVLAATEDVGINRISAHEKTRCKCCGQLIDWSE